MIRYLLSPNATGLERSLAALGAAIKDQPVPIRDLWNPQTCPGELLPWLAWAFSVDDWDPDWPEEVKRAVIAASFDIHRHKGTRGAMERALAVMGFDRSRVIEWFEETPRGTPYTFRVEVKRVGRIITAAERSTTYKTLIATKNVRSHLAGLAFGMVFEDQMRLVCALRAGTVSRVLPWQIVQRHVQGPMPPLACVIHARTGTRLTARVTAELLAWSKNTLFWRGAVLIFNKGVSS